MKTSPWGLLEGIVFGCQLQLSVRPSQKSGLVKLKTYNFRGKVVSQNDDPVLETSETRYRLLSSSVVVALFFSFFDPCFSFSVWCTLLCCFFQQQWCRHNAKVVLPASTCPSCCTYHLASTCSSYLYSTSKRRVFNPRPNGGHGRWCFTPSSV